MAQQEPSPEALTTDQPTSVASRPNPASAAPGIKRRRQAAKGAPQKGQARGRPICSASGQAPSSMTAAPASSHSPSRRRSRQDRQERTHDQRAAPAPRQGPPQIRGIAAVPDLRREAPLTPTICGSLSRARWGARSATNSRYLCAEPITGTTIASATRSPGGRDGPSIPSPRRGCSGFRPGVSNKDHQSPSFPRSSVSSGGRRAHRTFAAGCGRHDQSGRGRSVGNTRRTVLTLEDKDLDPLGLLERHFAGLHRAQLPAGMAFALMRADDLDSSDRGKPQWRRFLRPRLRSAPGRAVPARRLPGRRRTDLIDGRRDHGSRRRPTGRREDRAFLGGGQDRERDGA